MGHYILLNKVKEMTMSGENDAAILDVRQFGEETVKTSCRRAAGNSQICRFEGKSRSR